MEDLQKIILQMMERQVQQQKELQQQQQQQQQQQRLEQQQQQQRNEERLLQELMKSDERQNQMEELLLKSLNGTKASENDTTFSLGTIYSTIETFEYVPESDKNFYAFYRRYEDVFNMDCKEWSKVKKGTFISQEINVHSRFVDFPRPPQMDLEFSETVKLLSELLHKRWKCLNIFKGDQQDYLTFVATVNKHCKEFKSTDLTADDLKCLIFAQGLVLIEDAEIRRRVLTKL